jgi:hypothetical protein
MWDSLRLSILIEVLSGDGPEQGNVRVLVLGVLPERLDLVVVDVGGAVEEGPVEPGGLVDGVAHLSVGQDEVVDVDVSEAHPVGEGAGDVDVVDPEVVALLGLPVQVEHHVGGVEDGPAGAVRRVGLGGVLLEGDPPLGPPGAHHHAAGAQGAEEHPGAAKGREVRRQEPDHRGHVDEDVVVGLEHVARLRTVVDGVLEHHHVLVRHVPVGVVERALDHVAELLVLPLEAALHGAADQPRDEEHPHLGRVPAPGLPHHPARVEVLGVGVHQDEQHGAGVVAGQAEHGEGEVAQVDQLGVVVRGQAADGVAVAGVGGVQAVDGDGDGGVPLAADLPHRHQHGGEDGGVHDGPQALVDHLHEGIFHLEQRGLSDRRGVATHTTYRIAPGTDRRENVDYRFIF